MRLWWNFWMCIGCKALAWAEKMGAFQEITAEPLGHIRRPPAG